MKLTRAAFDDELRPTSSLTPGRREKIKENLDHSARDLLARKELLAYVEAIGARSLKIEEPADDSLMRDIAERHPGCRFLTSLRPFVDIATSNSRLVWGKGPTELVTRYKAFMDAIAPLYQAGRLFVVDVSRQADFDHEGFLDFLDRQPNERYAWFIKNWPVVNSLEHRSGFGEGKEAPAAISERWLAEGAALDRVFAERFPTSRKVVGARSG